ncbi:MAG TPA: hypothetical protein VMS77_00710 [Conexivisphaerales archaeon]|nr:hypothetical protein [Conexivisphaerales archaeon]
MTAKPRIIASISLLVVASWVILLVSLFIINELVLPFAAPQGSSYDVVFLYAIAKALAGGLVLVVWLYSFYVLRDSYARLTGLTETPSSSASRRTRDESRTA